MITQIRAVFLYVTDQQRAVEFYVDKLGLERRTDEEVAAGARWVEVAPHGAETPLVLAAAENFDKRPVIDSSSITFATSSLRQLREELRGRGVELGDPVRRMGSTYVEVSDPDGHTLLIGEA